MSPTPPPKSKMTARSLLIFPTDGVGRRLGPGFRGLSARGRQPATLLQALLVQGVALRAHVAVPLELVHRVVDVRLVPLPVALGAAADQRERRRDHQEAIPSNHERHGTMPPIHAGHHHRRESSQARVAPPPPPPPPPPSAPPRG